MQAWASSAVGHGTDVPSITVAAPAQEPAPRLWPQGGWRHLETCGLIRAEFDWATGGSMRRTRRRLQATVLLAVLMALGALGPQPAWADRPQHAQRPSAPPLRRASPTAT